MTNFTQLDVVLDAMPFPAVLISPQLTVAAMNSEAAALLGQGLLNRHYVTALRQPGLLECVDAVVQDGKQRKVRYEQSEATGDCSYDVTCTRLTAAFSGAIVLAFEDVTPIETAGQMRRDFVANVSHELRTPLTALLGFIETLRGRARDDPAARDRFLDIMQDEADRMRRLVRDLLSLSRVEAEGRSRPQEPVDITGHVASAIRSLQPLADARNLEIEFDMKTPEILVAGDADQLLQVFTNLIENALKYANSDVSVDAVTSERLPILRVPGVTITVADRGEGIDPVHIPRLTERFYRVDAHRSREIGGTGLGLAIVKHIVNRHGGRLTIESVQGEGSRFSVSLPTLD